TDDAPYHPLLTQLSNGLAGRPASPNNLRCVLRASRPVAEIRGSPGDVARANRSPLRCNRLLTGRNARRRFSPQSRAGYCLVTTLPPTIFSQVPLGTYTHSSAPPSVLAWPAQE